MGLGQIFKPDSWTGEKEKKFDVACSEIVSLFSAMEQGRTVCREAKEKKPVVHFVGTVTALASMAWIGNRINSFFLLYLLTLTAAMLPGLHRRGLLKKYFSMITLKVSEAMVIHTCLFIIKKKTTIADHIIGATRQLSRRNLV